MNLECVQMQLKLPLVPVKPSKHQLLLLLLDVVCWDTIVCMNCNEGK